jgi:hypothetical protein
VARREALRANRLATARPNPFSRRDMQVVQRNCCKSGCAGCYGQILTG